MVVPWLGVGALVACDGAIGAPGGRDEPGPYGDPGHVTVHRLNNAEYANTVRDLLGTTTDVTGDLPADDYSHGFDNISAALSLSPVQVDLYQRAAHEFAAEAMRGPIFEEEQRIEGEEAGGTTGREVQRPPGTAWGFFLNGVMKIPFEVPVEGAYAIRVRAWARQGGDEVAKMEVSVDGQPVRIIEVEAKVAAPQTYEIERRFDAGRRQISVAFINDFHDPDNNIDRNLFIDWVAVNGPIGADGSTPVRDRVMVCDPAPEEPEPCVRSIATEFGTRAFRRPLTDEELERAMGLFEVARGEGGTVDDGIQLMLEYFLSSPRFLFRFEIDPDPTSLEPRPLDEYELASRLSYFLWSSMPDDELFASAEAGHLSDPAELRYQVRRMLDEPKADAIVENFAGQWLFLRGLEDHEPDYDQFPDFDEELVDAMVEETSQFFREFLEHELPVNEMLTADFTFVNPRLAEHYGMDAPASGFERVSWGDSPRRGLFGQASILTVTSHPDRTSPVKRGQWVLDQLLCEPPPPPPPGVEGLEMDGPITGPIREQMRQHRTDPVCSSCHAAMDPIGFALEHFGPTGKWRDQVGEYAIDATGELPSGESFEGGAELGAVLAGDERFTRCLTEKMMIYALGRGLEPYDARTVERIHREVVERGSSLPDLILQIATSDPFLYRRGEPAGGD